MNKIKKPKALWEITLEKFIVLDLINPIVSFKDDIIRKIDEIIIKFDNTL